MGRELARQAHALLVAGFVGQAAPDWLLRRVADGLGGVVLFARNVADQDQVRALTGSLRAEREDLLVAVDEEGGDVTRLEAPLGSRHPGHLALGRIDDVTVTRAVAASIGALLDDAGADWDWAPVADVSNNPWNPVIGVRAFGADAPLVSRHAAAIVTGLQDDAGILACAKHFPGHGDTATDSHRELPVVTAGLDELREVALAPFRACIDADVRSIMTAHLRVLAVDPSGPATLSRAVVGGLLRDELGYRGLVVADALEMGGVAAVCGIGEAAVRALEAGVDCLCLGGRLADEEVVAEAHEAVVAAVVSGRLPGSRVAEASGRVAAAAAWRDARRGRGGLPMSDDESLTLARRALRVEGRVRLADGAPVVVSCEPEPLVAAGPSNLSVGRALAVRRPGALVLVATAAGPALAAGVLANPSRPVVLVLRDQDRHPWQVAIEAALLRARPDTVVVELGLPAAPRARAAGRITTFGVSRAAVEATVSELAGSAEGRKS